MYLSEEKRAEIRKCLGKQKFEPGQKNRPPLKDRKNYPGRI